jgi:branched-chain amino acid aminotransferase
MDAETKPAAADARFAAGAAYCGGEFVPVAEARLSVLDFAFTRSDSTYDVVHVKDGAFFRLEDHLNRFAASMARRRLAPPEDRARIAAILHRVVWLTGLRDAYVAMVALRGRPRPGMPRLVSNCDNHLICYALPWIDVLPPDVQARGGHLWIASTPRIPDASIDPVAKNYMWSDLNQGLMEAQDHGHDTAVLIDQAGLVTEGPGFNVFVVKGDLVKTAAHGSLMGITRRTVLELAYEMGLLAEEGDITRAELEDADEVFLASTAGGVMPVSRLGSAAGVRIMNNDAPGPVSARIKDMYWAAHRCPHFLTPVRGDTLEG